MPRPWASSRTGRTVPSPVTPRRGIAGLAVALLATVLLWWTQADDPTATDPGPPESPSVQAPSASPTDSASTAEGPGTSMPGVDPASGLPVVSGDDLPPEAGDTLALIDRGGPFPHDEDGTTFGNREGILPEEPTGYYAEFTVETPGLDHRGARRIVTGDDGELYWTDDHYASFSVIDREEP